MSIIYRFHHLIIFMTIISCLRPSIAADIPLGNVPVNIELTDLPKITVEKPGGGWYDVVTLSNSAGSDITRYHILLPVQISIRNESSFMVSLVEPLVLSNEGDESKKFINETVSFGTDANMLRELGSNPVIFTNTSIVDDTYNGSYYLSISAHQPIGSIGTIAGSYIGKLVLMFEVKV